MQVKDHIAIGEPTGDHTLKHGASHLCVGMSRVAKQLLDIAIKEVVADEQVGRAA